MILEILNTRCRFAPFARVFGKRAAVHALPFRRLAQALLYAGQASAFSYSHISEAELLYRSRIS